MCRALLDYQLQKLIYIEANCSTAPQITSTEGPTVKQVRVEAATHSASPPSWCNWLHSSCYIGVYGETHQGAYGIQGRSTRIQLCVWKLLQH